MRCAVSLLLVLWSCHARAPRLSPPQIVRAAGIAAPGDAWDHAYAALVERLGLPTRVRGAAYLWAARDGPDCYLIEVHTRDGVVAFVDDPYRPVSPARRDIFDRCVEAAR